MRLGGLLNDGSFAVRRPMTPILPPEPLSELMAVHLDATQRETASRIRIPSMPSSGKGSTHDTVRPGKPAEEQAA